mmetsp:Transcript_30715/g.60476  ORF Transcript_30715/g.60476 Transcript_30715/m.60476 type:complete len:269 (-) Transcript_30715:725-1531(-)
METGTHGGQFLEGGLGRRDGAAHSLCVFDLNCNTVGDRVLEQNRLQPKLSADVGGNQCSAHRHRLLSIQMLSELERLDDFRECRLHLRHSPPPPQDLYLSDVRHRQVCLGENLTNRGLQLIQKVFLNVLFQLFPLHVCLEVCILHKGLNKKVRSLIGRKDMLRLLCLFLNLLHCPAVSCRVKFVFALKLRSHFLCEFEVCDMPSEVLPTRASEDVHCRDGGGFAALRCGGDVILLGYRDFQSLRTQIEEQNRLVHISRAIQHLLHRCR